MPVCNTDISIVFNSAVSASILVILTRDARTSNTSTMYTYVCNAACSLVNRYAVCIRCKSGGRTIVEAVERCSKGCERGRVIVYIGLDCRKIYKYIYIYIYIYIYTHTYIKYISTTGISDRSASTLRDCVLNIGYFKSL